MDTATLLWGLLFGSIGMGFFIYGRKEAAAVPLVCGLALMVLPYMVESTVVLVILGIGLMAAPYFLRA